MKGTSLEKNKKARLLANLSLLCSGISIAGLLFFFSEQSYTMAIVLGSVGIILSIGSTITLSTSRGIIAGLIAFFLVTGLGILLYALSNMCVIC
ncbi:hypothetical protein LS482_00290 [Sinomicrobium kalidii]|uniref:hypothetical protein n=1 Tax=Sinomicrobium kalidii TaxID=2900738 RepID=UPI001E5A32D7|nr:hypothetical protein [Sinomicrobium kalidii]UGU16323.1 hypothetical protein LS482_00290 [Sinomicrobium kalidii]